MPRRAAAARPIAVTRLWTCRLRAGWTCRVALRRRRGAASTRPPSRAPRGSAARRARGRSPAASFSPSPGSLRAASSAPRALQAGRATATPCAALPLGGPRATRLPSAKPANATDAAESGEALGLADADPADQLGALQEDGPGEGGREQEAGGAARRPVDRAEDRDPEQDDREEGGVDHLGDGRRRAGSGPRS